MNARARLLISLVSLLLPMGIAEGAELAFRVKDINTTATRAVASESFLQTITLGDTVFLAHDDGGTGSELWKVQGANGVPTLVKDICPGACSSQPNLFTVSNGLIFFAANDGVHGWELWKSDGTAAGTVMIGDLRPGSGSPFGAFTNLLTGVGGAIYFRCFDRAHGEELCVTDGTAAGTRMVADINPGLNSSQPSLLAVAGDRLLLSANDGVHGWEPWITDGTAAGTRMVGDLNPGPAPSLASPFFDSAFGSPVAVALGLPDGSFVFGATDGGHGNELWHTDGTEAGTALVKDVNPGTLDSAPAYFALLGGKAYFRAFGAFGGLWRTDGTEAGTVLVKTVNPRILTPIDGKLYFNGDDHLWTSDGTPDGTFEVSSDLSPSAISGSAGSLLIMKGGSLAPNNSLTIWRSDGTRAGTVPVKSLTPQFCHIGPLGFVANTLYFYACSTASGREIWKSDGTEEGTVPLTLRTATPTFAITFPLTTSFLKLDTFLVPFGHQLFFGADDGMSGPRLWHTDGSAGGTQAVPGVPSAFAVWPSGFVIAPIPLANRLIFSGTAGVQGLDPEGASSEVLVSGQFLGLVRAGGLVFFGNSTAETGTELWKTDGTAAGTGLLKDVFPGPTDSIPALKGTLGTFAFFEAHGTSGRELWRTDGTEAGTVLLQTLAPFGAPGSLGAWAATDHLFFYTLQGGGVDQDLWRTDGTPAGTVRVKDFPIGEGFTDFSTQLMPAGDRFFFLAFDADHGKELWVSDGTEAGTHRVKDIRPGAQASGIGLLVSVQNRIFFTADDGAHGIEPWVSDGTEAGTRMVKDVMPGAESSLPTQLAAMGHTLVFTATDGVHGSEPWVTNGNDAGTFMLKDIVPGEQSSGPMSYTNSRPFAYFVAQDGASGAELWAAPRLALEPTFEDVHSTYWAWRHIEAIAAAGITKGCGPESYCPTANITRAETAVFLLLAEHGPGFVPPPATGTRFADVPADFWAGRWIEQLAAEGITSGCGGGNFCPGALLSRAQMAVQLLVAKHGSSFVPPPATGTRFADVPADFWAGRWIEQLATEGITSGCGGGNFCPDQPITRAEMAVFVAAAFGLPLP
jgi:ELWxxDGT repeat protein